MQPRILLAVAAGLALAGVPGVRAAAQNDAPFTIRQPPDGATVREKVKIRIPLASIPEGGYVSLYIDDQFRGALSVTPEEREAIQKAAAKAKEPAYFDYTWDTKAPVRKKGSTQDLPPGDGKHTIVAKLYEPKATTGTASTASVLKETSSVEVTVANKFDPGNIGPIKLQYKFSDGENRDYSRKGVSAVVAGLSQGMMGTGDQELVSYDSNLHVAVEDIYPRVGHAIVRNKMNKLEVRQGGQVSFYPTEQLPNSLYQEIDPFGNVVYQNSNATFQQFAELGIPVSTTLEMPVLPKQSISVGDVWPTTGKLDIPGTPPDKQPSVQLQSKFEGFEWEGGYPTAHIKQTYDSTKGGLKLREVVFGAVDVTNPSIKFEQDIYVAYRSGKLVKVAKKLEVVGKTTQSMGAGGGAPSMGSGGGPGGPGMMRGGGAPYGGPGGGGAGPYGGSGGMMMRGGGAPYGGPGGGGGGPYGGGGPPAGGMRNMYGGGGGQRGGSSGGPYGGGQRGPRGGPGKGGFGGGDEGLQGGGSSGGGAPRGGGFQGGGFTGGGGFQGGNPAGTGDAALAITLKSTTVTELNQTRTAKK